MLLYLSISRLAIIDRVTAEFGPGLSVLTGETGAGKSIIVGAVELLLGGRASADMVRSGEQTATIEAILRAHDGREVIVRRELTSAGRSRAFVDGTLVNSGALREVTSPLIDLHGQHDHQALLDAGTHLELLDRFGGLGVDRAGVASAFAAWKAAREKLESSEMDARERAARLELVAHQLEEIDKVDPRPGEDDELGAERQVLAHAERLQRLCTEAYEELYEREDAALAKLSQVWKRVAELASLDPSFAEVQTTRDIITSHLGELAHQLRDRASHLENPQDRLQAVETRLAGLERLKRRYGPPLAAVLAHRDTLRLQQQALSMTAESASELARAAAERRAEFLSHARRLGEARRRTAIRFARCLAEELTHLAMQGATCEFRFEPEALPESAWTEAGIDGGELYLSANVGELPRPLARIASGGELSRVMLAIKTLASNDAPGKTLIFDEVDAGIGGQAADAVGSRLRSLGATFQVLCITHLPQVAAHAHAHFRVTKDVQRDRTVARLETLTASQRAHELARMIGGTAVTEAVLDGARELLASRAKGEQEAKGESESHPAPRRHAPRIQRSTP